MLQHETHKLTGCLYWARRLNKGHTVALFPRHPPFYLWFAFTIEDASIGVGSNSILGGGGGGGAERNIHCDTTICTACMNINKVLSPTPAVPTPMPFMYYVNANGR